MNTAEPGLLGVRVFSYRHWIYVTARIFARSFFVWQVLLYPDAVYGVSACIGLWR
jgi:hypothetical protein